MRGLKPEIIPGQRYGCLTVLRQGETIGPKSARQRTIICHCECGQETTQRASGIFTGRIVSCGCVKRQKASARLRRHGAVARGRRPASYGSWRDMRGRCNNPGHRQYKDYGGRGVSVCERWDDYAVFISDMGEPAPGLTIERIDVNGHYEPSNCRWATKKEQALNKRTSVRLQHGGELKTVAEWAAATGLASACIRGRLKLGWPVALALTLPASHSNVVNPRTGRCAV